MVETTKQKVAGWPLLRPSTSGVSYCPGCGYPMVERAIAEVLEDMELAGKTIGIGGAGCHSGLAMRAAETDGMTVPHGRACDIATGMKRYRPDRLIYTVQGDGDAIAIGAEGLINAAGRSEKFTVIMLNNANFGNTGGQMAPTTLTGQVTSTTLGGRTEYFGYPIHVAELLATVKGVAYAARTTVSSPAGLQRTKRYIKTALQKQIDKVGFSFVEILSMCPADWHLTPFEAIKFLDEKLIGEYPLGEFKNVDKIS